MDGTCGNVAAIAHTIGVCFAIHGKSHFAIENDVRRKFRMSVIRIVSAWRILPHEGVRKTFGCELLAIFCFLMRTHRAEL